MYVISGLYSFTLLVQVLFLMMEEFYKYSVIVDILLHKILFEAQAITIYWVLEHTGSGLKLMSHRLNDGSMQFEGEDRTGKHLFTFRIASNETDALLKKRTSSDFTDQDADITQHTFALTEGEMISEYDTNEQLLLLE